MDAELLAEYKKFRENDFGFYEQKRGLIAVSGKEAVQFLNGLITNDVAKMESHRWMRAAFPNAQGRTLAVARVLRMDEKFIFDTEETTREKVFNNLFRFTFAGDFFVEDLSENFTCFSLRGGDFSNYKYKVPNENEIVLNYFRETETFSIKPFRANGIDIFVPRAQIQKDFAQELLSSGAIEIGEGIREVLRIENGEPLYDIDFDETTIVSELGIDDLISYKKGCYIGQEIIARIHFRGHVAKQLTGLVLSGDETDLKNAELKSLDGKNAGRVTSTAFSPTLGQRIALAFVRYDYLAEGTELKINATNAQVKNLPFVK